MDIKFIKETAGIYGEVFIKGEVKTYRPWRHEWRGMTEPDRVAKDLFVECHGHGEFNVFTKEDVKRVARKPRSGLLKRVIQLIRGM